MGSGGKGGDGGPSQNQIEAYNAGQTHAGNYNSLEEMPGYAQWSGSNPGLTSAMAEGFSVGSAQKQNDTLMTQMMNMMTQSQSSQSQPSAAEGPSAEETRNAGILSGSGSSYADLMGTGNFDQMGGEGYIGFNKGWKQVGTNETDTLWSGLQEAMSTGDFSSVGTIYTADGKNVGQGIGERDSAISAYAKALGGATDTVNAAITREQARASSSGTAYSITDEVKSERIGNALKDHGWTSELQTSLDDLTGQWGAGDFQQSIYIGEGVEGAADTGAAGDVLSTSGSMMPKNILTEDEDALGSMSILGG